MSFENNDEFVVFPSGTGGDSVTFDVRYSRSHNPGYAGGRGRQHRPTEPTNTTLRCSNEEALGTPGPVCEATPSLVKVPRSRSGPPGIKVNGPGKSVEPRSQGGLVRCTWKAAELGVEPASVNALAGVSGSVDGPRPSRPAPIFAQDDLRKILHGGQRMASVHNGEEILPKASIP